MKTLFFALIPLLALKASMAFANPVQIRVQGLRQDRGAIVLNLFASAESWQAETPDQVLQIAPLRGAQAETTMDLPVGTYAFFLFHDIDGNGQLKRGSFGLPAEPYAFSNNVHIGFSKPSFPKMKFEVTGAGAVQEIQLVNP